MTDKLDSGLTHLGAPSTGSLIVCPRCHYGFSNPTSTLTAFVCPRAECGHRWQAATKTMQQIHLPDRRRMIPELRIVAGAPAASLELAEGESLIGREPHCQLILDNLNVSRRHARLSRLADHVWIEDLGSSRGTVLNGHPLKEKTELRPRDEIIIGGITMHFDQRFAAVEGKKQMVDNTLLIGQAERSGPVVNGVVAEWIPLTGKQLTFGRAPNRDVVLPDGMISRRHAVLEFIEGHYFLSDVQSQIGTFVNGRPIIRVQLETGDRIQLGPYLFRYEGDQLNRIRQPASLDLIASQLVTSVGKVQLLDEVSLVLEPGEFVGLLGPSGAGKTTLLDALNGFRPARSGQVLLNGEPLYEQYERLRHLIGYVPQNDNIHKELTCSQALMYAARLRLPPDATDEELGKLVTETLATLDLTDRADVQIGQLSGGQRKRANVGVELLSKPGILFLDEPTAGLDPSTESRLMRKFKQLATQGRTVVCTTHVMENIDLFDKVAVLAPGGRLAFFGPPAKAKTYFGIDKFTLLYEKLEEQPAEKWKELYLGSELGRELLAPAMRDGSTSAAGRRHRAAPAPPSSVIGQWATLTKRFSAILRADKQYLGVLALQPLLIATLVCLVCRGLPMVLFLTAIAAIWFGCSMGAQQIVRERAIYRRERMVNLRLDCYILSKFLPLAILSSVQCAFMLAMATIWKGQQGNLAMQVLVLFLSGWSGVAMGLLISARAANADKATSIVPLTILPQIILAGALIPLPDMTEPTRYLANLTVSKWANSSLEVSLLEGRTIDNALLGDENYFKSLWNLYPEFDLKHDKPKFIEQKLGSVVHQRSKLILDLSILSGFVIVQLFVVGFILRRQDAF